MGCSARETLCLREGEGEADCHASLGTRERPVIKPPWASVASRTVPGSTVGLWPSLPAAGRALLALLHLGRTGSGPRCWFWHGQETPTEEHLLPLHMHLLLASSRCGKGKQIKYKSQR